MAAIRHFHCMLGYRLWVDNGFYDSIYARDGWWATSYLAIDQGPMVCMIENYRTNKLWDLFMSCDEVKAGLVKLGWTCGRLVRGEYIVLFHVLALTAEE